MNQNIEIRGAREHNLKNVNVDIPRGKFVVITGVSGSGKSSLAFDTLYAEGYRKYMESLSVDARRQLEQVGKPDVDFIHGISPVVAIDQHSTLSSNPRSTVATATEIADYARLVWALLGDQRCPDDGGKILNKTLDECVDAVTSLPEGSKAYILAQDFAGKAAAVREELKVLSARGWQRVRLNGKIEDLEFAEDIELPKSGAILLELVIDRLAISPASRSRIADSLELAFKEGGGKAKVSYCAPDSEDWLDLPLNTALSCEKCGKIYEALTPRMFSYNHPDGACPECAGIGRAMKFNPALIVPDDSKSVRGGAIKPMRLGTRYVIIRRNAIFKQLAALVPFDPRMPWKNLPQDVKDLLVYGDPDRLFDLKLRRGTRKTEKVPYWGALAELDETYRATVSDTLRARLAAFQVSTVCGACKGSRLNPRARNVFVGGVSFDAFLAMSVERAAQFVATIERGGEVAQAVIEAIKGLQERLNFLCRVGLSYISLGREYSTLSGGESQRIRLATQLGMDLTGVTYILDEPSIGLHPSDNNMLFDALDNLRDKGNTVIVVEHDKDAMLRSEHLIELGAGAGELGGNIVFEGTAQRCMKDAATVTGRYLAGKIKVENPRGALKPDGRLIKIRGASEHNLKNINVDFPVGLMSVVCGVSGSGKSTLVNEILAKHAAYKLNGEKK